MSTIRQLVLDRVGTAIVPPECAADLEHSVASQHRRKTRRHPGPATVHGGREVAPGLLALGLAGP